MQTLEHEIIVISSNLIKTLIMKTYLHISMYVIFRLLILSGLFWQLYEISIKYFSYHVTTGISFNLTIGNVDKAINLRFMYYEVFDQQSFARDKNFTFNNDTDAMNMFISAMNFTNVVTIEDIMKYTPSVDDLLLSCDDRGALECSIANVSVEKYVNNMFVIYRFIFNYDLNIPYDESTTFYTPNNYAIIIYVILKETYFTRAHIIAPFLNDIHAVPYEENAIAINSDTGYDFMTHKQSYLAFGLRVHSIVTQKLAPPYSTKCIEVYDYYQCLSNCINNLTVTAFNRLAPTNYYRYVDDYMKDMKIISFDDVTDHDKYRQYLEYLINCSIKCPKDKKCHQVLDITNLERSVYKPMQFYQTLSDSPSFIVKYHKKTRLVDYITLFMSCFGTWLGISILDLVPFKDGNRIKRLIFKQNDDSIGKNEGKNIFAIDFKKPEILYFSMKINSLTKRIKLLEALQKEISNVIIESV